MGLVVTGLSQNGDTAALHEALAGAGLATDRLQTIGPDESTESVAHGIIGADLLTSDGGSSVPGVVPRSGSTVSQAPGDVTVKFSGTPPLASAKLCAGGTVPPGV